MLVHPGYVNKVSPSSFDPQAWSTAAIPVSGGGRGSAWFLDAGNEHWVLRQYSRGGLVARISRRLYFFGGSGRVRSFSEFRLLNQLQCHGMPVPVPVAARYQRVGPCFYQAEIIVRRIPGAVPFADYLSGEYPVLWREVGALVRRFHDAGVYHADLNCHNILVADDALYLIDFDKGHLSRDGELPPRLKSRNLKRLKRSLAKQREKGGDSWSLEEKWALLMDGYEGR